MKWPFLEIPSPGLRPEFSKKPKMIQSNILQKRIIKTFAEIHGELKLIDRPKRPQIVYDYNQRNVGVYSKATRKRLRDTPQRSKPWKWFRFFFSFISGSIIGAICNVNPFQTTGEIFDYFAADEPIEMEITEAMMHGTLHEERGISLVKDYVESKTKDTIQVTRPGMEIHKKLEIYAYSPDAIFTSTPMSAMQKTNKPILIEMKMPYTSQIPWNPRPRDMAQVQLGLEVLNLDVAILAYVKISHSTLAFKKMKLFTIRRDAKYMKLMHRISRKFIAALYRDEKEAWLDYSYLIKSDMLNQPRPIGIDAVDSKSLNRLANSPRVYG